MNDAKAAKLAGVLWSFLTQVATLLGEGSPLTEGAKALARVGAIIRKVTTLLERGHSVEEILKGMDTIPDLVKRWREDKTSPETPAAKKAT